DGLTRMEVLKFKNERFTSEATVFSEVVGRQKANGGDDLPETSFEALSEAARVKDWRKAASRVLILITDAPPKLDDVQRRPGHQAGQSVKETIDSLRDNKIDLLHLVIGDPDPRHLAADPGINARMQKFYREVQQGAL